MGWDLIVSPHIFSFKYSFLLWSFNMIVKEKVIHIEKSEGLVSQEFRIKASRKAFEILSGNLYSNKLAACVRELSTNAVDSHVMAGKPTDPIIVHLPNSLEPYFSVKD